MEITNQTLFFYPFSGENKQDLYSIIKLFREMYPKEDKLTIIMADTFGNEYYSKLLKFIYEIGYDQNHLSQVKQETVEHSTSPTRNTKYLKISRDYGWSKNANFDMNRFKLQLKEEDKIETELILKDEQKIEIDLIFTNMDAFNCFDFLKENYENHSIQGEINLILKYPGQGLNIEGFKVFSALASKFPRLNKVFVCEENKMLVPKGYTFISKLNSFNIYQNNIFDSSNISKLKRVIESLRYT